MDATRLLEEWCRKGYFFKIEFYGGYSSGDSFQVQLWNSIRNLNVSDYEHPNFEIENYVSLGDLILYALDKWSLDDKPKNYQVLFIPQTTTMSQEDPRLGFWSNWHNDRYSAKVVAKNDQEAEEVILLNFGVSSKVLVCKEKSYKNKES